MVWLHHLYMKPFGQVYWRASEQPDDITRAANLVSQYFRTADFNPKEVVVVSWDQVGYFNMKTDRVSIMCNVI